MLGQLPCKKEELPSAYVHVRAVAMYMHVRAVAMYHAKTHGNSGKRVVIYLQAKLGQLPCTLQKHMATDNFGCGRGDGRVGEVINAHTPASLRA